MSTHSLHIADAARTQIDIGLRQLQPQAGSRLIPAVLWLDSALNGGRVQSGVIIGAYPQSERVEISDHIQSDNGYEFVLNVPDHELYRFLGKTLDYRDGQYVLV